MQRLHQNIVCAELLKLLQQMRLAMTTEYDHPRRPGLALPPALQRSENLEPVHLRHPQIEQHRRRFRPDCSRIIGPTVRPKPAAVLLDLWMPKMDGFEVLRTLESRRQGQAWAPRVVVLSGHSEPHLLEELQKLGAHDACLGVPSELAPHSTVVPANGPSVSRALTVNMADGGGRGPFRFQPAVLRFSPNPPKDGLGDSP